MVPGRRLKLLLLVKRIQFVKFVEFVADLFTPGWLAFYGCIPKSGFNAWAQASMACQLR